MRQPVGRVRSGAIRGSKATGPYDVAACRVAEMLAMLVEAMGHETMVEHHPLHALTRIERERPDVCLLDIGLPDVDGYELARRVRTMFDGAVTLFAVTGYGQPQNRERAIAAGFDEHFTKPLDGEQLAKRIASLRHAS